VIAELLMAIESAAYRLRVRYLLTVTPERRYQAALEDAYAALCMANEQASNLHDVIELDQAEDIVQALLENADARAEELS
jgi:hypothetical protein